VAVSVAITTTVLLREPVAARESLPRVKSGYAPVRTNYPEVPVAMIEEFLDAPMPESSEKKSIPTGLFKEKQR
jgi:hypothetical protein